MNYLTNYYKNLSEQLQRKVNQLTFMLNEMDNSYQGNGQVPEPLGDSDKFVDRPIDVNPNSSGNIIGPNNYYQVMKLIATSINSPPSWWNNAFYRGGWEQFVNDLTKAIEQHFEGSDASGGLWNKVVNAYFRNAGMYLPVGVPAVFPWNINPQQPWASNSSSSPVMSPMEIGPKKKPKPTPAPQPAPMPEPSPRPGPTPI